MVILSYGDCYKSCVLPHFILRVAYMGGEFIVYFWSIVVVCTLMTGPAMRLQYSYIAYDSE